MDAEFVFKVLLLALAAVGLLALGAVLTMAVILGLARAVQAFVGFVSSVIHPGQHRRS